MKNSPVEKQRMITRPKKLSECPVCGQAGRAVGGATVKSLITVSLRLVKETPYYFCRTETCPVVYFTADGSSRFTIGQIRERVYQKFPNAGDAKVCYCFEHRVDDIRQASPAGRLSIIEDINSGIAAGQCACDLRNPQGSCCLGNVQKLVRLS